MRINSGNVAMEASHLYSRQETHAVSISVQSTAKNYATLEEIEKSQKGKSFRDLLQENDNTGEAEASEEKPEDTLLGLTRGFKDINQIMSKTGTTQSSLNQTIQLKSLMFLINLFSMEKLGSLNRNAMSTLSNVDEDDGLDALFSEQQSENGVMQNYLTTADSFTLTTNTIIFQESYQYAEEESTALHTTGTVVTADGREINFGLEMEMSRRFQESYDITSIQQHLELCDPLVINFDGNVADVSDQKFLFDIDADGALDSISELGSGSGYLAMDLNNDGKINDGSELFGTKSGNGFDDLAKYDSDGDGWIDEDDEAWSKLMIWSKDENGNDTLYHLTDKGIGAICLKNENTEFSLNSMETNAVNARIRKTGIFLYENGNVGTVQHVDLAKERLEA